MLTVFRIGRLGEVLFEDEFCSFALEIVVHLVEGAADEMDAEAAGLHEIEGTAIEAAGIALGAEIANAKADALVGEFANQADQLIWLMMVGVTDHIGAGFVDAEDDEVFFRLAEIDGLQELPDKIANEAKVRGMAGKFDFAFHSREN